MLQPVSHAVHHRHRDHQRVVALQKNSLSHSRIHLWLRPGSRIPCASARRRRCLVCKPDVCFWDCEPSLVCVCVSRSCIHPCVLCVSLLVDINKRSRCVEAAKQDIPSLSYRLPLLLWHTAEILPHPVHQLLLLLSLFSLSYLPCYTFTFLRCVTFQSLVSFGIIQLFVI